MALADQSSVRTPPVLSWTMAVALAAIMVVAAGVIVVVAVVSGPQPPFLDVDSAPVGTVEAHVHADDVVHLAGSGSNLPLTRALARAFEARGRGRVVVHASIGSGGGIRAVHDGVVEVGLASRPITPAERALGMEQIPYARTPVSLAAHPSVVVKNVTSEELLALYGGERSTWDDGTRVVVLQREEGDSSHRAVAHVLPEFKRVNDRAYDEGRWRVLHHDGAMRDALVNTPGAIGLFGQGAIPWRAPYRAISVDGVAPTVANVEAGEYPFHKTLSFVIAHEPRGLTAQFLEYVTSAEGQALIREAGYVPLKEDD